MRNPNARVSSPEEFVTCPGETIKITYSSKVNPDGTIMIEPSGKIDIKSMINSQRELTDIAYITRQLMNGDDSGINTSGFYGDITSFPKTFAEVLQLQLDALESWDRLSADQKKSFDNDFNQFFATAGSEAWFKNLGLVSEEKKEGVVDEQER